MIKKQHVIILTITAVVITTISIFGQQSFQTKNNIKFNTCTGEDGSTYETTEPCKEKTNQNIGTLERFLEQGYVNITNQAIPTNKKGWLKYEYKESLLEINKSFNSERVSNFSDYNLYFPADWTLFINKIQKYDENGEVIGDLGGGAIVLVHENSYIGINPLLMGYQFCSLDKKPGFIPCTREIYANIENLNNTFQYVLNDDSSQLTVCDTSFYQKEDSEKDMCSDATKIGNITFYNSDKNMGDAIQFLEIIKRIEIVQ